MWTKDVTTKLQDIISFGPNFEFILGALDHLGASLGHHGLWAYIPRRILLQKGAPMGCSCRYCSRARFYELASRMKPEVTLHWILLPDIWPRWSIYHGIQISRFWKVPLLKCLFWVRPGHVCYRFGFPGFCDDLWSAWLGNKFQYRIDETFIQTYRKYRQFWYPFWVNFGCLGPLGATLGSQRLRRTFQASIFKDCVSKRGPIGDPKITLGASR